MRFVVRNSFQIYWFVNYLSDFSIIVQKNHVIQIASCEPALISRSRGRHQCGMYVRVLKVAVIIYYVSNFAVYNFGISHKIFTNP